MWKIYFLTIILWTVAYAAPQAPAEEKAEPVKKQILFIAFFRQKTHFFSFLQYEYKYEVKDPEKMLFFDKNEMGDGTGKVNLKKNKIWKIRDIVII